MEQSLYSEIALTRQYKDHTVPNPVDSNRLEDLPLHAYDVHNQPIRELSVTVQVLDEETDTVIETLNGYATDGNISVDASSMIQRTGKLDLIVTQDTFPQPSSLMWFNRYLKVYVGIEDSGTRETMNFLVGTFWIDHSSYNIDENEQKVSFDLSDKMTKWEDSQLETAMKIERGTPIDVAIKMLMEHVGENKFGEMVEGRAGEVTPYTIEYGIGSNVMDLIKELRDMYMEYVCGYNVRGEFELKRIELQTQGALSEPKWRFDNDSSSMKTLLSFSEDYSLKNIRNRVLVYGGTSDVTGLTPSGESRLTDSKSPFNINAISKRTKVIVEDKYVTNEQCIAHAKYELHKSSSFQEISQITTLPIYFMDANDIIEIVHSYTGVESQYIIDSINFGLTIESVMNISARKLYYVSVEYGEEDMPLVDYVERGIRNYGWIRLAEDAIVTAFNVMGAGTAMINVSFENNIPGFEQARVQAYPTTNNQSMVFDLADMQYLDLESNIGEYINGANKSTGDNLTRLIMHEMFHVVLNDFLGYSKAIQLPLYFSEGMAELTHGARERFKYSFAHLSDANKKQELIKLADWVLDGNFTGASDDYTASFLVSWAIYRILKRQNNWENMMSRLRGESNLSLNFLTKLIPNASSTEDAKSMIMQELNTMTPIWDALFSNTVKDTGSVLGVMGENYYGMELTKDNIINPDNFIGEESVGFEIRIIK